jgi:hypothetical protein
MFYKGSRRTIVLHGDRYLDFDHPAGESNGDENGSGRACPNRARIRPVNNLVRRGVRNITVLGQHDAIGF